MTSSRMTMISLLALAAPALGVAAPANCPRHLDVRNLMTVTQFDNAGLQQLNKKQLAALNQWLSRYVHAGCAKAPSPASAAKAPPTPKPVNAAPSGAAASEAAFGNPPSHRPEAKRIESHIVGEFHGWTGNTVFRLANGQIWKQAGPGYFRTDMKSPKVVIKKLLIGYVLTVHGYAKEVFVRRVH